MINDFYLQLGFLMGTMENKEVKEDFTKRIGKKQFDAFNKALSDTVELMYKNPSTNENK